jgi:hypothetical protein
MASSSPSSSLGATGSSHQPNQGYGPLPASYAPNNPTPPPAVPVGYAQHLHHIHIHSAAGSGSSSYWPVASQVTTLWSDLKSPSGMASSTSRQLLFVAEAGSLTSFCSSIPSFQQQQPNLC